jgi:hypothetical protein
MRVFTVDILPHICSHLTCVTDLNHLSRVNKGLRDHIQHSSHEHWRRIGRETCGHAYWNEALFAPNMDGRYTAKLHLCPWLSAPKIFELRTLHAYNEMDAAVTLKSLKVCPALVPKPTESELYLRVHVHESLHAKGGPRLIVRCARDEEASDSLCMPSEDASDDNEDYTDDDMLKFDLQVHLQKDPAFTRFARRYGLGELACVHIVHARMFAAIFDEGRAWRYSTILFISMDDHTRILHDFRFIDGKPECVAFSPGEMWCAESSGYIHYHGPRADMHTVPHTLKGHGRIARAFFATANGRAQDAVDLLQPLGVDDLRLFVPKTALTLFDIAADPDGCAMQHNAPLPPDALHLLRIEPRFATGVHMMQRAIRAMDTLQVRALADAGCPGVSYNDVKKALPPEVEREEAMNVLSRCGLRIRHDY